MSNINVNNLTPLLGSGSSVSVSGSLVVKNDVTIGGHLYIGDQDTDSVTFSAEVSSSVIPDANITYDLGSSAKKWNQIYVTSLKNDFSPKKNKIIFCINKKKLSISTNKFKF